MSQKSEVDVKNHRSRATMILSSAMSRALRLLSTVDSYISRHSAVVLWSGLIIFLGRVLVLSRLKMLWRDEILTWAEAQSPTLSALWSGLTHAPTTVDPPLHPIMAFLALRLPGPLDLRLRLPSFIGFAGMMLS